MKQTGISWDVVYPDQHATYCPCEACEKKRYERTCNLERSLTIFLGGKPPEIVSQIGQVRLEAVEVEAFQVVYPGADGKVITSPVFLDYAKAVKDFAQRVSEEDQH